MAVEAGKTYHFIICTEADVASATYITKLFTEEIGFNAIMQSMIATAVSELATNIVKYAGRGCITVGLIHQMGQLGIEVIAEDQGSGITDRVKAMSDHFSTGHSLGLGLPGVRRLMDEFLMDSSAGLGTKIVARKWKPY